MAEDGKQRQTVEQLAEEFAERYRRGERPPITEYVERYPEFADEIRDLFPALVMMEDIAPSSENLLDSPPDSGIADADPPRLFGDYRIIRQIGRGGMGIVYEAEQISLGRHVALKVLPNRLLDEKQKRRFEREAKAAANLHHTNIVPVFGVGEHNGLPYYAMQFIQGLGLDEVLKELRRMQRRDGSSSVIRAGGELRVSRRDLSGTELALSLMTGDFKQDAGNLSDSSATPELVPNETVNSDRPKSAQPIKSKSGRLSDSFTLSDTSVTLPGHDESSGQAMTGKQSYWHSVARIGAQVAGALEYAHKQGTLHRDVKPSNLLLDTRGTVWITDFGLAKMNDQQDLTNTGDILGTLRYMPPEAFEGKSGTRGDIYSLGLTLYELLALKPAFDEKERNSLIKQVTTEVPIPLGRLNRGVPRDLQTIVHKAIESNPDHRYQTAQELADDLQRFLNDEPVKARRISRMEKLARWRRRNPVVASLTAALLLTFLAGFAGVTVKWLEAENQRELAQSAQRDAELKRREAEESQRNFQRMSARLMMERGIGLCKQGRYGEGLLWLTNGLNVVPAKDGKLEQSFRTLIGGWGRRLSSQRVILEFDASVESAAFCPDGRTVIIGCSDGTVWLWTEPDEAASLVLEKTARAPVLGKPRPLPVRHKQPVNAVAVSPDGQTMATGSRDGTIQLWTVTGQAVGKLLRHDGPVRVLAFSPNSKTLASACNDGTARLWSVDTGRLVIEPLRHDREVRAMTFNPDGAMLVTGSDDATARVWDTQSGKPIGEILRHGSSVRAVAFSPDSRLVLTASNDRHARLWNAATGKLHGKALEHSRPVADVAFSPDGKLFATGCEDHYAYLRQTESGQSAGAPLPHANEVIGVEFSPDGRTLLTNCDDDSARLWDVASGRLMAEPLRNHDYLHVATFSPDGRTVMTGGHDNTLRLWQTVRDNEPSLKLGPAAKAVLTVAFSPDGQTLFVGSVKGNRYDRMSGRLLGMLDHSVHMIGSAAYSPDGKTIAVGSFDATVRLWDAATGQALGKPLMHLEPSFIRSLAFSRDGRALLTASGNYKYEERRGEAQLWEVATGKLLKRLTGHEREVTACAFSPDGKMIATASRDGLVRFWDAATGKPKGKPLKHQRWINSMAFSPDGKLVVTGGDDHNAARLWNVANAELTVPPFEHPGAINAVAFSPDGRLVVTGCQDGAARFWEVGSGRPVDVPIWHGGPVHSVAWSPDGSSILTGSADGWAFLVPVPGLFTGSPQWIRQWVRVNTNMQIDPSGNISKLNPKDWHQQVQDWTKMKQP